MKKIKIKNCEECPFCNSDNEYGYDRCNLENYLNIENITLKGWNQLPDYKVHEHCLLKNESYLIGIDTKEARLPF